MHRWLELRQFRYALWIRPNRPNNLSKRTTGITSTTDTSGYQNYEGMQGYRHGQYASRPHIDMSKLPPGAAGTRAALEKLTGGPVSDQQVANASAYLDTIAYSEGTSTARGTRQGGYDVIVGGGIMNNLSNHPHQVVQLNATLASSAAGRYQFLGKTWDSTAQALNLRDFSANSQDAAALYLIQRAGALNDVMNGDFASSVNKTSGIWASLPGAGYGQHENDFGALQTAYNQAVKMHQPGAAAATQFANQQQPNHGDLHALRVASAAPPHADSHPSLMDSAVRVASNAWGRLEKFFPGSTHPTA